MRRLLRDVAEGRVLGDTTTLTDPIAIAGCSGQVLPVPESLTHKGGVS